MPTLYEGAQKLVFVCANVRPEEKLLIITDDEKFEMAQAVREVEMCIRDRYILNVWFLSKITPQPAFIIAPFFRF